MYQRKLLAPLLSRLKEPRRFIQVLAGPRQVGKTTLARQAMDAVGLPFHYGAADDPSLRDRLWIEQQWELGRLQAGKGEALLVLDEIQKVKGWSEAVKRLWDDDTRREISLKVVLLGSSHLLVQKGLTESLAGRFEILRVPHWSFDEVRDAFGWGVEQYVYFGGYPGAAGLVDDRERWSRYIVDSLIETTLSQDILLMTRVDKPSLLRQLFHLGCAYSGQVLSYQKMVGQLQDAGNTTTLAHYLDLLAGAGLLAGLPKYHGARLRQRGSSPKLQVLNMALLCAQSHLSFEGARQDREYWGRLVESTVGAHLYNSSLGTNTELYYWRHANREVDFVLRAGETVVAIEVKSGRRRAELPGFDAFTKSFRPNRILLVGGQGIPLEEFLGTPAGKWVGR